MLGQTTGSIIAVGTMLILYLVMLSVAKVCGNDVGSCKKLIVKISIRSAIMVAYFIFIYDPFIASWCETLHSEILQIIIPAFVPAILLGPMFFKMAKVFLPDTAIPAN